ncbi:Cation channel sperm-associated protein 1 [Durusdinium trenchii]|uniref:Cation channel sperm-associated protein 1 n=1 Tax=Durusdinium trenchii TaxID=1381693 RepID=A0ABP0QYI9_9DINO
MARPADRAGRRADGVRTERWDEMQRRLARKAGQVATFEDTPRLLKAAEEPEAWEELLQTWPEALGPASRLRPTTGSSWVETKDVPSLEELLPWIRDALGADFVRENFHQLAVRDRGPLASRDPAPCLKRRPSGAKTPPRLQLEGPKTLRESLEKFMASLQGGQDQRLVDLLGVERQPRTVARQHYDLNKDPRVAVDEFVLATRKAERRLNARKLAAWGASELVLDRGSSPDRARAMRSAGRVSSQSDEPEQMSPRGRRATARSDRLGAAEAGQDQMRSHLLERLDYLHTCRGSMGESLYAQQRHRNGSPDGIKTEDAEDVDELGIKPGGCNKINKENRHFDQRATHENGALVVRKWG